MTTIDKKYYVNVKELMDKAYPRPNPKRQLVSGVMPLILISTGEDK